MKQKESETKDQRHSKTDLWHINLIIPQSLFFHWHNGRIQFREVYLIINGFTY